MTAVRRRLVLLAAAALACLVTVLFVLGRLRGGGHGEPGAVDVAEQSPTDAEFVRSETRATQATAVASSGAPATTAPAITSESAIIGEAPATPAALADILHDHTLWLQPVRSADIATPPLPAPLDPARLVSQPEFTGDGTIAFLVHYARLRNPDHTPKVECAFAAEPIAQAAPANVQRVDGTVTVHDHLGLTQVSRTDSMLMIARCAVPEPTWAHARAAGELHLRINGTFAFADLVMPVPDDLRPGPGSSVYKPDSEPDNRSLLVCVSPIFLHRVSGWRFAFQRLVEFMEYHRYLGVTHYDVYLASAGLMDDELTRRELALYASSGLVSWYNFSTADKYQLSYHGQTLALNDCLVRNVRKYKFVMNIDIDEFMFLPAAYDARTGTLPRGALFDLLNSKYNTCEQCAAFEFASWHVAVDVCTDSARVDKAVPSRRGLRAPQFPLRVERPVRDRPKFAAVMKRVAWLAVHQSSHILPGGRNRRMIRTVMPETDIAKVHYSGGFTSHEAQRCRVVGHANDTYDAKVDRSTQPLVLVEDDRVARAMRSAIGDRVREVWSQLYGGTPEFERQFAV